jgi:caffeoyl-CoA O-methyltransferase
MADRPKTHGLDPALYDYLVAHGTPPDAIQRDLIAETRRRVPDRAGMQIAPDQGALLTTLTGLCGARRAVEVGTFTGYSALCIARGLPPGGRLTCFDANAEWVDVGRPFWERAGVADRIEVRIGDAAAGLRALPAGPWVDLAFVDADKAGYPTYYEELLARLAPGGVLIFDNVLAWGRAADPTAVEGEVGAIRAFNDRLAADGRVDKVMLSVGDGMTLARHRDRRD